jgi:hypothetical protein
MNYCSQILAILFAAAAADLGNRYEKVRNDTIQLECGLNTIRTDVPGIVLYPGLFNLRGGSLCAHDIQDGNRILYIQELQQQ